jgi:hypothetical protein
LIEAENAIQRGFTVSDIVEAETLKQDREKLKSADSMDSNSPPGSSTQQIAGQVRKKFRPCLLAVNSSRIHTKNHLPLHSNNNLLSCSSPSLLHCPSTENSIALSVENFKTLSIQTNNNRMSDTNPRIERATNPLCCYSRRYFLPLPSTSQQTPQQTIQMLLLRAKNSKASSSSSELNDFMRRTQALPFIDDDSNGSLDLRSQHNFKLAHSTASTPQQRRPSLKRLMRRFSHQILPKIANEGNPQVSEYATQMLNKLHVPLVSTSINIEQENLDTEEDDNDAFSLGIPSIFMLDNDDAESIQDGKEAAEADDPFTDHWNSTKFNCQERPIVVDLGFDDTAKSFWNNDFYNNNKYNSGTPWHDLVGMFSNNALARQQADDEEMEEKEEGSWNLADWNASEIGQAASYLMVDGVLGELVFDDNDEEDDSAGNPLQWLFGNGYFVDAREDSSDDD